MTQQDYKCTELWFLSLIARQNMHTLQLVVIFTNTFVLDNGLGQIRPHRGLSGSEPIAFLRLNQRLQIKTTKTFYVACCNVLLRKASSSAEWTEASEESNQEQILWA